MEDWSKKTDEQVFMTVGEQIGSQASYWRDIEIRRRHFLLAQQVATAEIAAAKAQVEAAEASKKTALWTRVSAVAMAASVIVILITSLI